MKRGVILVLLFGIILLPLATSTSIDNEIKKITSYSEDYETGNINYAQLSVYVSAVRQNLNEILGVVKKEEGGLLKQEQLKPILGEPKEETEWIWVEKEEHETRLEHPVPIWEKIVFDGKKIQIRLNAYPSLLNKNDLESLVYRLHFSIEFKKPKDQLDMLERINKITDLAKSFSSNPSDENAESLAKESVNAEKVFQSYFRQAGEKCENIMTNIFGDENKKNPQNLLVQQADFFEGKNFGAMLRLEMCDDCEWNWINLDLHIEGRGPGFKPPKELQVQQQPSKQSYETIDDSEFEKSIIKDIEEIKTALELGDYSKAFSIKAHLWQLNEAWNQKSNNLWPEIDKLYESKRINLEKSQNQEPYWWIKLDQEKKEKERELRKNNYEKRKQFYINLLSKYKKKEFYFTQVEYEKRLVEEYKEFGKEICDNNNDDNNNNKIDCSDEQCSGKICGKQKFTVQEGNVTDEIEKNLYCISSICQLKNEVIHEKKSICGNHICESNETKDNCTEDCVKCKAHDSIDCTGKLIFKGKDKDGCPLEPFCMDETNFCEKSEDCIQTLCGKVNCIENVCKTTELEECKNRECDYGEEKTQGCESGEMIVIEKCIDSMWRPTGLECVNAASNVPKNDEKPIVGNDCNVKDDCGGEDDVCSNGICVTVPKIIQMPLLPPIEEKQVEEVSEHSPIPEDQGKEDRIPENDAESEQKKEPTITGKIIKAINSITGLIVSITGFEVNEPQEQSQPDQDQPGEETKPPVEEDQPVEEILPEPQPRHEQPGPLQPPMSQEQRDREEGREVYKNEMIKKDRKSECKDKCKRECHDRLLSPCIGKCVMESECNELSCVDEQIKTCEESCSKKKNTDDCESGCLNNCIEGKEWEISPQEDEHKQEKGVFKAGGQCRNVQQKTEGFIYFDGWGDPFEKVRPLKMKYYEGGNADWCKDDLENLKKQRKELEESFNQKFAEWFFEKYLSNSAEEWEQHVSGIFELFWKDVDISREMAFRMNCLDIKEMPDYSLINFSYKTSYGELNFWEELKSVRMPNLDEEVMVISPYMKIWIFPPKHFISFEMKKSMQNHEFPGPPEEKATRKNEEGPTEEERLQIKKNKNFMKKIKKLSDKYDGNVNIVVQFKDYEKDEIVFNLYAQLNEEDIIKIKPMLPSEVPKEDIKIEIDFEKIYNLISSSEKEMRGSHIESPPWDRKERSAINVKEVVDGIKMYFKVRDLINSAKVSPQSEEGNVKDMVKSFFTMMMKNGVGSGEEMKKPDNEKKSITGEIIKELEI